MLLRSSLAAVRHTATRHTPRSLLRVGRPGRVWPVRATKDGEGVGDTDSDAEDANGRGAVIEVTSESALDDLIAASGQKLVVLEVRHKRSRTSEVRVRFFVNLKVDRQTRGRGAPSARLVSCQPLTLS